jgi:uncharacterized protein YqkB
MVQSPYAKKREAINLEINITTAAAEKINERINGREGYLKLKYDTDGCGCAVNGVVALWFIPEVETNDIAIETNDRTIYVEKSKTVFFDEQMKIDFSSSANCFQLKSPQQILNGHMSLIIKEKTD